MRAIRIAATVLARFLLSAIFLASGVNKIFHWHEMEKMLMNILCDWQTYMGFSDTAQHCFTVLTPWTPLLLIAATLLELVGGLLLLLGVREKLGASLLVLVLIPTTIIVHQFWFVEGGLRDVQQIMFLKNLAILGGLLMVLLYGAQSPAKESGFGGSLKLP
jgi:putative oxidoreductase